MSASRLLLYTCSLLALSTCACERERDGSAPIRVAAAADLTFAFEELGRNFERQTGQQVTFSFGSSGLLSKQVRQGAPFDVFAAANARFVDDVIEAGSCDSATKVPYARGRLAIWTKRDGVSPPRELSELADARFKRIAIANPEHAPYGQAAKQALQHAGLLAAVESKLILGENVRQTLQFAESGNAEAAIVALSLVMSDRKNPRLLIDEAMHPPIEQALVVCTLGKRRVGGESFARFVNSQPGRALMRRHGFLLPGESLANRP